MAPEVEQRVRTLNKEVVEIRSYSKQGPPKVTQHYYSDHYVFKVYILQQLYVGDSSFEDQATFILFFYCIFHILLLERYI